MFWFIGNLRSLPAIIAAVFLFNSISTPILQLLHGFLFMHQDSERWFGTLRAYGSLGFVVMNLAVGIVADRFTGGQMGFIFPLYATVSLGAAAWMALLPEKVVPQGKRPTFFQVQKFFLGRREVAFFLVVVVFYQAAHSLSYAFQSVLMVGMGADMRLVAFSYSLAALLELPVFFAANRLITRFGEVRLIVFAAAVQAVRWLLVWGAGDPTQIILISTLHSVTFGVFYAASISYMNKHAGLHLKASAQTLFALVYFGVASMTGNLVGGQVTRGGVLEGAMTAFVTGWLHLPDRGSLGNLYILSSMVAVAACLLGLVLLRWEKRLHHGMVLGEKSPERRT
jgi:PPP family 3-phenylpropionic acid transporter